MRKSLKMKHPQLALTELMDVASVESFHECVHLSLTSKNTRLENQEQLHHYLSSQVATYDAQRSNFNFHEPHFLTYE
jgi:hypothetical protein